MSDVREVLEDALRDYVAERTDGAILTDYFVVAASTEFEDIGTGSTLYMFLTPETQPAHVSMGLLAYAVSEGSPIHDDD
jgi:hypothetical protein